MDVRNRRRKAILLLHTLLAASAAILRPVELSCEDLRSKVLVVFRYDDYSQKSNGDIEEKIITAFSRINESFTIGIIPYESEISQIDTSSQKLLPLSGDKADILKKAHNQGVLDIALHGYSHQIHKEGYFSEFSGLPPREQEKKIIAGKKHLEELISRKITTFIPPFNSYDAATVELLYRHGFEILSASRDGESFARPPLSYIPATATLSTAREAVETALDSKQDSPIVVILFHEYDFVEVDNGRGYTSFEEFSNLLKWISSLEKVEITTVSRLQTLFDGEFTALRFQQDKRRYAMNRLLPSFLGSRSQYLYERERSDLFLTLAKIIIFYAFVALIPLLAAYSICRFLLKNRIILIRILFAVSIAISMILTIYILKDFKVSIRGMSLIVTAVAGTAGLFFGSIKKKRRSLS